MTISDFLKSYVGILHFENVNEKTVQILGNLVDQVGFWVNQVGFWVNRVDLIGRSFSSSLLAMSMWQYSRSGSGSISLGLFDQIRVFGHSLILHPSFLGAS